MSDTAKSLLFLFFMYGIGYSAGPGFIRGIREGGWRWVALGRRDPGGRACSRPTPWRKLLNLELGYAAGMMSGRAHGVARHRHRERGDPLAADHRRGEAPPVSQIADRRRAHLPVRHVRRDLLLLVHRALAAAHRPQGRGAEGREQELGLVRQNGGRDARAWHMFELRAYGSSPRSRRGRQDHRAGRSAVAERCASSSSACAATAAIIAVHARTSCCRPGDVVAVIGRQEALLRSAGERTRPRCSTASCWTCLRRPSTSCSPASAAGRPHAASRLAQQATALRGVFLKSVRRGAEEIPVAPGTRASTAATAHDPRAGAGGAARVRRDRRRAAASERHRLRGARAWRIFAGALLGLVLSLPVGGVQIALGSSVATLLSGWPMGWRNSVRPTFALLPPRRDRPHEVASASPAFVAMIGLKAGPVFLQALTRDRRLACSWAASW